MNMIFNKYTNFYDFIYYDKNYSAECIFLEKIFKKYSKRRVISILDIGCGTGSHSVLLAKKGYKLNGIDFSGEMLNIAKQKIKKQNLKIKFTKADMRNFNLNKKFDAAIVMFAAMGYLTKISDFIKSIKHIRKHLNPSGLFIFDVWYAPTVFKYKPSDRKKVIKQPDEEIIRLTHSKLDISRHLVDVIFTIERIKNNKIIEKFKETHQMRFFSKEEIINSLTKNGFSVIKICPFMKLNGELSNNIWNITVIAKKCNKN